MCFGTYIRSLSDLLRTQPLKNKTKIKCEHTRAKRASENEVNNGENKRCMKHGESGEREGVLWENERAICQHGNTSKSHRNARSPCLTGRIKPRCECVRAPCITR